MAATSGARRRRVRPGTVPLAVGLVGLASAVTLTAVASYPVPLGVMLGLVLLFMVGIYLTVGGAFELRLARRVGFEPADDELTEIADRAAGLAPPRSSWRCRVVGHHEVFRARTSDRPAHWECSRCGGQSHTHLHGGRAWVCQIPFVDHLYDGVAATDRTAAHWRCRRCGARRFSAPMSAGETLNATRSATMWIKRDDG